MELNNLKKIRELVGLEINNSFNEIGTEPMRKLCFIQEDLDKLILLKENPNEYYKKVNKVNKSMTLGVK